MYSNNARWYSVAEIDAPREMLIDIAQRHKKWHGYDDYNIKADYYWNPYFGMRVVIDGPNVNKVAYRWHKNVKDYKWENMEKIL